MSGFRRTDKNKPAEGQQGFVTGLTGDIVPAQEVWRGTRETGEGGPQATAGSLGKATRTTKSTAGRTRSVLLVGGSGRGWELVSTGLLFHIQVNTQT